ncbi:MAG: dephospho-CoA kinase [Candidatus Pelagibacter sp.]|tara:strand:+ start:157 stop:732 length:576 start_codon:yes stop_codon:yes gene_type:complete
MIKIGILGEIGSGKTFIAKKFKFPVFSADEEVTKIYQKNKLCFLKLKKKFPEFIKNFPIDKKELGQVILYKKNNLKKITEIIHPIVRKSMYKFLSLNKNKKAIVLDIPLLLENKLASKGTILIYVDAKKELILKRLLKRKFFDNKIFAKLRSLQFSKKYKKKKSDYIIKNNFKSYSINNQVNIIRNKILKK